MHLNQSPRMRGMADPADSLKFPLVCIYCNTEVTHDDECFRQ